MATEIIQTDAELIQRDANLWWLYSLMLRETQLMRVSGPFWRINSSASLFSNRSLLLLSRISRLPQTYNVYALFEQKIANSLTVAVSR